MHKGKKIKMIIDNVPLRLLKQVKFIKCLEEATHFLEGPGLFTTRIRKRLFFSFFLDNYVAN